MEKWTKSEILSTTGGWVDPKINSEMLVNRNNGFQDEYVLFEDIRLKFPTMYY